MSPIRPLIWLVVFAALAAPATLFGAAPPASDPKQDKPSLAGQLLVAAPSMRDPRFAQTVLVVIRHNTDGAFALVVNRPAGEESMARLLKEFGESNASAAGRLPIFYGGPVQPEHAFVLHSTDYRDDKTLAVSADVAMTADAEILHALAGGTGPAKSLLAFGYAGWAAGQLENELKRGDWYTTPLDPKLVFDADRDKVWDLAVERRTRDL